MFTFILVAAPFAALAALSRRARPDEAAALGVIAPATLRSRRPDA